jgi:hypothetical protein
VSIRIQPRARAEAEQAAAWYEEQRPGLGIEFVLELDAAIERAEASPPLDTSKSLPKSGARFSGVFLTPSTFCMSLA